MNLLQLLNTDIFLKHDYQWITLNNNDIILSQNEINNTSIKKEFFISILTENKQLMHNYFGISDASILEKMIQYYLTNNTIIPIASLDSLFDDTKKILIYNNINDIINNFDNLSDRYTIFLENPWQLQSKAILSYYDIETNNYPFDDDNYSYFLEISFIRDELWELYHNELKKNNMFSNENLINLLFYYARYDSHMDINLLSKKKNISLIMVQDVKINNTKQEY